METWNKDQALKFTREYLLGKGVAGVEYPIEPNLFYGRKGHRIIKTSVKDFYWIFKKNFFNTFAHQFQGYNSDRKQGESVNVGAFNIAKEKNMMLLFCYEDKPRRIYTLNRRNLIGRVSEDLPHCPDIEKYPSIALLKIHCVKNKLVRVQDRQNEIASGGYSAAKMFIQESTYSFPIDFLERFKVVA